MCVLKLLCLKEKNQRVCSCLGETASFNNYMQVVAISLLYLKFLVEPKSIPLTSTLSSSLFYSFFLNTAGAASGQIYSTSRLEI